MTERLRRFFAALTAQLAAGTADIWAKVERQVTSRPHEPASENIADVTTLPPHVLLPMQQQPLQQQQQKATPSDDGKKTTPSDHDK